MAAKGEITLEDMRSCFASAVGCDALDAAGCPNQSPRLQLKLLTVQGVLIGRCRTTLWGDMAHPDPRPYELELKAVDSCGADDVLICAAGGSMRSGIWGELLSTAARNRGCVGVVERDFRRGSNGTKFSTIVFKNAILSAMRANTNRERLRTATC